jgi:hypothetical protein
VFPIACGKQHCWANGDECITIVPNNRTSRPHLPQALDIATSTIVAEFAVGIPIDIMIKVLWCEHYLLSL